MDVILNMCVTTFDGLELDFQLGGRMTKTYLERPERPLELQVDPSCIQPSYTIVCVHKNQTKVLSTLKTIVLIAPLEVQIMTRVGFLTLQIAKG